MSSKIPQRLHLLWSKVLDLKPNQVLVLRSIPRMQYKQLLKDIRKAIQVSEKLNLYDDYTIIYAARKTASGYDIFFQKQPVINKATIVEINEDDVKIKEEE